ncbi:hypothetical protein COU38_01825 [Candidatus Micrarchaeota archaeon CG10_big_fil_rev_8_21_14_0_10_54_18]|nr:MAG: hypothetical protein AUJ15_03000 [Candidatus Micrarchaeota archaeon CG1_02_55_41]PJD01286.1 MAG: hypothetical protein COU38_01825 [Candidatus Micrarchaeota archaeon CG10_big_fil_rev_8_21_14_0_10_54_18]
MKFYYWFLLLLLAVAAGYYFYSPQAPTQQDDFVEKTLEFGEENRENFLTYENEEYAFTVEYPVGYNAVEEADLYSTVKFYAGTPYSVWMQEFNVYVVDSNESFSVEDVLSEESDWTGFDLKVNGRNAHYFETTEYLPEYDEELSYKYLFVECGDYLAWVTALTPTITPGDLVVADYVLHSFKCQT